MKKAIKQSQGYLWGAGIASVFIILTAKHPLTFIVWSIPIHIVIYTVIVYLVYRLNKSNA